MTPGRLTVIAFGCVLCMPLSARAVITVSFGHWFMGPTDSIVVPIMISTDASEEISEVNLYLQVEDGETWTNGPYATAIEFLDHPTLPDPIFSAVSSSVAAYGDPWDVENGTSTGLKPAYAVFTNATSGPNEDVPASGVLAYVTFETVNGAYNFYTVSFTSDELGITLMSSTGGQLEAGVDYIVEDGILDLTPEPSSLFLALLACGGIGWAAYRRKLARRAARSPLDTNGRRFMVMAPMRRIAAALGLVFCLAATAEGGIFVSMGDYFMSANDEILATILISTDASEEISAVDLYLQVEDGLTFTGGP